MIGPRRTVLCRVGPLNLMPSSSPHCSHFFFSINLVACGLTNLVSFHILIICYFLFVFFSQLFVIIIKVDTRFNKI